jgi:hypothetical protein
VSAVRRLTSGSSEASDVSLVGLIDGWIKDPDGLWSYLERVFANEAANVRAEMSAQAAAPVILNDCAYPIRVHLPERDCVSLDRTQNTLRQTERKCAAETKHNRLPSPSRRLRCHDRFLGISISNYLSRNQIDRLIRAPEHIITINPAKNWRCQYQARSSIDSVGRGPGNSFIWGCMPALS